MTPSAFPLLGLTLLVPLVGAAVAAFLKSPATVWRWSLGVVLFTLTGALAASTVFTFQPGASSLAAGGFRVDDIAAPMLPVLAALHLLTLLGTSRSALTPLFCARLLLSASAILGLVTASNGSVLVALLVVVAALPVWDIQGRGRRSRGILFYLAPSIGLLLVGWTFADGSELAGAAAAMLVALRMMGGVVPLHGWLPTLFQRASFGAATLSVLPLVEVVAVTRLVLPHASEGMLHAAGIACLVTAVYSAGMAVVQNEARRFFAFLALGQTSMVMFAVMLHTPTSLTAALCLWISIILSLAGLGYSIRALEDRFGSLSLREHHGHYEQAPGLAVVFLIAGLASVGFPGTIGFVPMELLISGSAQHGLGYSVTLALASMLNGIAILRAYFSLFTGRRPTTSVSLQLTTRERVGVVLIAVPVLLAGWFSPQLAASRHRVAEDILRSRQAEVPAFSSPPASLPRPTH